MLLASAPRLTTRSSVRTLAASRCMAAAARPFVLGLTGSIGMGKSTVSGTPLGGALVSGADRAAQTCSARWVCRCWTQTRRVKPGPGLAARSRHPQVVHELYAPGGAAVAPVTALFPSAAAPAGGVDRGALASCVVGPEKASAMKALEAVVHPLVAQRRGAFLAATAAQGARLVVLDIPLLYETGAEGLCDAVVVVSAGSEAVQRQRVLVRPGMTAAKLDGLLARQVPDAEKRRRAGHVIDTGCSVEETRAAVARLVGQLAGPQAG